MGRVEFVELPAKPGVTDHVGGGVEFGVVDAEFAATAVDVEEVVWRGREAPVLVDDVALQFETDREVRRVEQSGSDVLPQ